jgi:hypothetical protein
MRTEETHDAIYFCTVCGEEVPVDILSATEFTEWIEVGLCSTCQNIEYRMEGDR